MSDTKMKISNKKNFKAKTLNKISVVGTDDTDSGHSQLKPYHHQHEQLYRKQSYSFMKILKKDYKRLALIFNSVIEAEQERERRNIEEILHLNKVYNQMQNDCISIKRKNWCRYCESEATYLSSNGKKFYCSLECEHKHTEFIKL